MNNRIEELAEQAEQYALDKANENNDEEFEYSFDDDFNEKFAKLIVDECIQLINKEINRLCEYQKSLPEWDENRREDCDLIIEKCLDISESIKQHFEGKN